MFNLFKRSSSKYAVKDRVWMSTRAKWNACRQMMQANAGCVFLVWFEDTAEALRKQLGEGAPVWLAEQVALDKIQGKLVVFAEHYPLRKREEMVYDRLGLKEIPVLSALDEPIFQYYGAESLQALMGKLGMGDDEIIGHHMLTTALEKAQRKFEEKVISEMAVTSAAQWFEVHLPK